MYVQGYKVPTVYNSSYLTHMLQDEKYFAFNRMVLV